MVGNCCWLHCYNAVSIQLFSGKTLTSSSTVDTVHKIWQEDFKIHSYEIGPSQFASPRAICCFLQEAASNHATALQVSAESMLEQDSMWVLSTLSLRMERYPRWRQSLTIETWPVAHKSPVRGLRDFVLSDASGVSMGRASTLWLLLDKQSRKLLKLPAFFLDFTSPAAQPEILQPVKTLKNIDWDRSQEFVIRGSDIDYNLHVNNVCYLDWGLEVLDADFRLRNMLCQLDISFHAEGMFGGHVIAKARQTDSHSFIHQIEDTSGSVLASMQTTWLPKPQS